MTAQSLDAPDPDLGAGSATLAQRMARGLLPVLFATILIGAMTYASLWLLALRREAGPGTPTVSRQAGPDLLRGTFGNRAGNASGKVVASPRKREAPSDVSAALSQPVPATLLAMAAAMVIGLGIHLLRSNLTASRQVGNGQLDPAASEFAQCGRPFGLNPNAKMPSPKRQHGPIAEPPVISALIRRLENRSDSGGSIRTLVTSEEKHVEALDEALIVSEALSARGNRVVLVIWSLCGRALQITPIPQQKYGMTDLLAGRATFEHIISRIPHSTVHLIQPGTIPINPTVLLDPDLLNLTLDSLDEAYDQIVVAGARNEVALLFKAIEGRFEAAVVVSEGKQGPPSAHTLLGFEVTGIDIVRWERVSPPNVGFEGAPSILSAGPSA